jgi:hypothetical protein
VAGNSSGGSGIAFVVGGLVVLVAIIALFVFSGGGFLHQSKSVNLNIKAPDVSASVPTPAPPKGG